MYRTLEVILMTKVMENFLRYVAIDTGSSEETCTVPSTPKQLALANQLKEELENMGLSNITLDSNGYVMAELKSNSKKAVPSVGFIAHMDTSPDMSGENVKPKIVENYNGKDIILNEEKNIVLSPKYFPDILNYVGKTLITTDGTTLLGADDKAGIAEIITAVKFLIDNPEIEHGTIKVAFTPDEEIGCGADHFDVEKFDADLAYTVDGGTIGELECENFNAAAAKIVINGLNVHPGYAKDKMINSASIGSEFISMLPLEEVPEKTEGYEGFYHLISINGTVEETIIQYIIRDFDSENFDKRKELVQSIGEKLNEKYGAGTVVVNIREQYLNMKEKIEPVKYVVDIAQKAMEQVGVIPQIVPIRGGTDGARLSFMGLPTPNLFTGGHNFHGKYEYIPVYAMEKAVEVIIKIAELYVKRTQ